MPLVVLIGPEGDRTGVWDRESPGWAARLRQAGCEVETLRVPLGPTVPARLAAADLVVVADPSSAGWAVAAYAVAALGGRTERLLLSSQMYRTQAQLTATIQTDRALCVAEPADLALAALEQLGLAPAPPTGPRWVPRGFAAPGPMPPLAKGASLRRHVLRTILTNDVEMLDALLADLAAPADPTTKQSPHFGIRGALLGMHPRGALRHLIRYLPETMAAQVSTTRWAAFWEAVLGMQAIARRTPETSDPDFSLYNEGMLLMLGLRGGVLLETLPPPARAASDQLTAWASATPALRSAVMRREVLSTANDRWTAMAADDWDSGVWRSPTLASVAMHATHLPDPLAIEGELTLEQLSAFPFWFASCAHHGAANAVRLVCERASGRRWASGNALGAMRAVLADFVPTTPQDFADWAHLVATASLPKRVKRELVQVIRAWPAVPVEIAWTLVLRQGLAAWGVDDEDDGVRRLLACTPMTTEGNRLRAAWAERCGLDPAAVLAGGAAPAHQPPPGARAIS